MNKNPENHLSIELGGGFSFLLEGNRANKTIISLEIYKGTREKPAIKNLLASPLIDKNFRSVTISICNSRFTLVPEALYDKEKSRELLAVNAPVNEEDLIHSVMIHHLNARLIFAAEKEVNELGKKFPNAVISHCLAFFLNRLPSYSHNGKVFHICFYPGFFFLLATDGSVLLFCNSFHYKSAEDVLYFLLFTAEQLHLDHNELRVFITGEIEENGEIFRLLHTYFIHPELPDRPGDIVFSNGVAVHDKHRFHNLTDQFRCAL